MFGNRRCIECGRAWYLPPKRGFEKDVMSVGERLVELATSAVQRESKFVCPDCIAKEVDRWETDGGH
jgi:hypothetical protein